MTREAFGGTVAAGATEVLVVDSHGQNIDIELLDKGARLIRA